MARSWSKLVGTAAGVVDRAFLSALETRRRWEASHAEALSHDDRLRRLAEVEAGYGAAVVGLAPEAFFPAPPRVDLALRPVRPSVWDASWPSAFEPFRPAVAAKWLARVENRTARARLFLAAPPDAVTSRPAVVAIHGYMGGQWLLEENQWPIEWLVRRGLDVALPVLPLHAGRAGVHRGGPAFPSSNPRLTNEGFRQAVADLRALVAWLRRRGAPAVGVVGMSLGGYTAALLATLGRGGEGAVDFVMPMIPLASIADFAREHGRLGAGDEASAQHAALERANWIVSPLARPLALDPGRALVVAAENDRVTPASHARRIAEHFGCALHTIEGAHLVQFGRGAAFRAFAALLEREGIIGRARRGTEKR